MAATSSPEIVLSEEQIQQKVADIAASVARHYGRPAQPVHVVCLLDNGFMFMADLVRRLPFQVICQFVKLETRDVTEDGHERRLVIYSPKIDVRGKDLLLVDCVLHTAITLDHLIQQFVTKRARSVKTAVLIDKTDERRVALEPDFSGFQLQGRFLVGYGLGHQEEYRNLPYVGSLAGMKTQVPATAAAGEVKE